MSMFYRPGESSSDDDSSEEEEEDEEASTNDVTQNSAKDSSGTAEDVVGTELTPTESLSTNDFSLTNSTGEDGQITSPDDHRSMMLATMLEELAKYKAAEILNQARAGSGVLYDNNSPEVQAFAKRLFDQSSGVLNRQGWLPTEAASEEKSGLREQYLTAFNAINARQVDIGDQPELIVQANIRNQSNSLIRRTSQLPVPFQRTTAGQLHQLTWEVDNMSIVKRPSTELQLAPSIHARSHYQITFEERGLLGRGGFGRVYHTYNRFDQQEYAIKKIPLSPKLSQKYRQGGHQELSQILREVHALAQLDHCNVVRYHATWIEEPTLLGLPQPLLQSQPTQPLLSYRGQLLLDNKPAENTSLPKAGLVFESNDDDPFERNGENDSKQLWSAHPPTPSLPQNHDTNPFSDGECSNLHASRTAQLDDPSVHVLHIQMSMYPMTLSEYLLPPISPRSRAHKPMIRHCFHIIPALRLLLGILCGLQYIHSKGFVHRDIKPTNIFLSMLDFAGPITTPRYIDIGSCPSCLNAPPRFINPRIGDFGLVADLQQAADGALGLSRPSSSSESTKAVGTEYYRPPQHRSRFEEDVPDEKIDVFALGVVFVELLWSCGTRMERIELLQRCQRGMAPEGLNKKLETETQSGEVAEMVGDCLRGMIDPDPKTRWRCDMVKAGIESALNRLQEMAPG